MSGSAPAGRVRVTLTATQKREYRRTFDLSREDYDKYQRLAALPNLKASDEFGSYLVGLYLDMGYDTGAQNSFEDIELEEVKSE